MTHLGTFRGVNNVGPRHIEPNHSMAHALISGAVLAASLAVGFVWMLL